ncbi:MAG: hypothetical protein ACK4IZ_10565 [Flavobacterium sp.]|uniref:hypothetical protein n=1 Tax=Flavobacterium TaxID=237 RepID=UPI00391C2442
MKNNFLFLLITFLLFSSCSYNRQYQNRKTDKEEAERVTVKLYYLLRDKKYKESYALFSPRFLEVTDTVKLREIYNVCLEKLGEIKDQSILSWETNVVEGSNPKSEYLLIYTVKRSRFEAKETIRLEKENDTLKIIAYNIQSKGFETK